MRHTVSSLSCLAFFLGACGSPPKISDPLKPIIKEVLPVIDDSVVLPVAIFRNICGDLAGEVWAGLPEGLALQAEFLRDRGYQLCAIKETKLNIKWHPVADRDSLGNLSTAHFTLQFAVADNKEVACLTLPSALLAKTDFLGHVLTQISYEAPGYDSKDSNSDPLASLNNQMKDTYNSRGQVFGCMAFASDASNSCGAISIQPQFKAIWRGDCSEE